MFFRLRNLVFILLLVPFFAHAQTATERYRSDTQSDKNLLDIYSFEGAEFAPVMIYVHGGAWQRGTRENITGAAQYFKAQGYVVVSLDYRLVPDVTVEDQFDDVDHAIRWVYDNIADYGGDPHNVHLMGHSAGAHLVAMAGVNPGPKSRQLVHSGAIRTVISNDTRTYDIPGLAATHRGRLSRTLAKVFGDDPARWQTLSPIYNIVQGQKPAFLILWSGQGDQESRGLFADNFAAALSNSGTSASVFNGSRYNHRDINGNIGRPGEITATVEQFLSQYN